MNIGTEKKATWWTFFFSADCIHLLKRIRIRLLFGHLKFGFWNVNIFKYKDKLIELGVITDKRVFEDDQASKMMDELTLKLHSKEVINCLIANWTDYDDIVTIIYFITKYPLLAVYTDITCKALTELTAFALYFFIEVYAGYAATKD